MTVTTRIRLWFLIPLCILLTGTALLWLFGRFGYFQRDHNPFSPHDEALTLALLVPDDVNLTDPYLTAWLDAAEEEGFPIETIRASDFLRPFSFKSRRFSGVILPDTIHRAASNVLLTTLDHYVRNGGHLMITFDAGVLTLADKAYAPGKSRLSDLSGIDYALYDRLKDAMIRPEEVVGLDNTFIALHVPPGKFYRPSDASPNDMASLFSYAYGPLRLAHFVTQGAYKGQALLYTRNHEFIAGVRPVEKGDVLFVNLPLGFLKTRTDGVLLHGFLHYFGERIARLPSLSNIPDGRGGLIMNWHLDSNVVYPALRQLKETKIFDQGPYSIHVTAGPDTSKPGDGLGFDLPGKQEGAAWLRFFVQRHDAVGSHGGWIHNYFGSNVNETNRLLFEPYLQRNSQAIERVIGQPITEYSAPVGTHPLWVTDYLESHHISSYYFTGNSGMGPTKTYRDGKRSFQKTWAFPISSMGNYASIEELYAAGVSKQETADWLKAISDFTANDHSVRLLYFHPPGILNYLEAVNVWLDHTHELKEEGRFSWYTMTDIANFLSAREKVKWKITRTSVNEIIIDGSHPDSMARQGFRLPADDYTKPTIEEGIADVIRDKDVWLVHARSGTTLILKTKRIHYNHLGETTL